MLKACSNLSFRGLWRTAAAFIPAKFKRSRFVNELIQRKTNNTIISGPFAGTHYTSTAIGSGLYPKLLGTYELELNDIIEELIKSAPDVVINIGAAEGYYAVGLALRLPSSEVIAFETSTEGQNLIARLSDLNGVSERVIVKGTANIDNLTALLARFATKKCALIVDIEGEEINLLSPSIASSLNRSLVLVESHDGRNTGPIGDTLVERFKETHEIARIWSRPRTISDLPFKFPLLNGVLRNRLDEGRSKGLCWLYMKPLGLDRARMAD
jgi:hypothetical protein